eukprot:m.19054 g.19054  ORF g.19054 m.19054 type:complete len:254 (-) comp10888_c0_seq1:402-1163(-)
MSRMFAAVGAGFTAGAVLATLKHRQLDVAEKQLPTKMAVKHESSFVGELHPGKYGLPSQENVHQRPHYVASVNYRTRVPNWVVQHLTPSSIVGEGDRKNERFQADGDIEAPFQATLHDYRRSGYSRGHLVPAGDSRQTQEAMKATFLLSSNIVPQEMSMNGCDWLRLERWTRDLTSAYEHVHVVSGPLWLPEKDHKSNTMRVNYQASSVGTYQHHRTPLKALANRLLVAIKSMCQPICSRLCWLSSQMGQNEL